MSVYKLNALILDYVPRKQIGLGFYQAKGLLDKNILNLFHSDKLFIYLCPFSFERKKLFNIIHS